MMINGMPRTFAHAQSLQSKLIALGRVGCPEPERFPIVLRAFLEGNAAALQSPYTAIARLLLAERCLHDLSFVLGGFVSWFTYKGEKP